MEKISLQKKSKNTNKWKLFIIFSVIFLCIVPFIYNIFQLEETKKRHIPAPIITMKFNTAYNTGNISKAKEFCTEKAQELIVIKKILEKTKNFKEQLLDEKITKFNKGLEIKSVKERINGNQSKVTLTFEDGSIEQWLLVLDKQKGWLIHEDNFLTDESVQNAVLAKELVKTLLD